MKKSLFLITALLLGVALIQSCQKETANADTNVTTSEDLAVQQDLSEEIDFSADIAIEERGGGGSCPTVTLEKPWGTWPNKLTIDYGTDGCTGPNGNHILKGKLIIEQTADVFTTNAKRSLTFDNFYIDAIKVEGTQAWTNNGINSAGQWSFTKTATGMKISFPDGTSTSWNHTHTCTLIEGALTLTFWDNVWSVTGNTTGTNREGVDYTATITTHLIKKASCRWISEGVVEFNAKGETATFDFGDGSCDRFATLALPNGNTIQIKMKP